MKINNYDEKDYIKVSNESGCILSKYNSRVTDDESKIIAVDKNQVSGRFKSNRIKNI